MPLKNCNNCESKVPKLGQCNSCGFVDGLTRLPNDDEFKIAREINNQHEYNQFENLDMLLLD
tara:strand:- start:1125 stop:1310 length:186 start_codon:yes stop_codon:yes gene_type:complete